MTPLLRFMRQRTCLTRTLTRDPYLIGSTRQCHTRTLTCDPLPNRVKSSKAHLSHKDPHSFSFINKEYEAHCHTRTLSHDPFIGAKHGAAYARNGTRKTGRGTRNNERTRHNRHNHSPQDEQRTRPHPHYKPPSSTKHNQSHSHHDSRQHKSPLDTKPQQRRHTQPNHCQTDLSTKNKFFFHKTTTNRRRNISSISRQMTPPSANTTYPTNPRQYDHQPNSPRTPKTHKVREGKQGGD